MLLQMLYAIRIFILFLAKMQRANFLASWDMKLAELSKALERVLHQFKWAIKLFRATLQVALHFELCIFVRVYVIYRM